MEGVMVKTEDKNIVNVCPEKETLCYVGAVRCPICKVVFQNTSSCELHQIKRHKKQSEFLLKKPIGTYRYFCPIVECKYNSVWKERYFNKLKYLRQHYLKSHAERKFFCTACHKSFPTQNHLVAHTTKECGIDFTCTQCNATYSSREALLTHNFRTGHARKAPSNRRKENARLMVSTKQFRTIIAEPPQPSAHLMENIAAAALSELSCQPVVRTGVDKTTQTEAKPKRWNLLEASTSTQTERDRIFPEADSDSLMTDMVFRQYFTSATQTNQNMVFDLGMFQEDIDIDHVHNETQTELIPSNLILDEVCPALSDTHTQTAPVAIDDFSHNCTQTCDDALFNDFVELSDIETQTAWASLNVDSLLVSAQTQTLQ